MDAVNKPPHYQGEVEAIDCIKSSMSYEGFKGYLDFIYGKDSWWLRGKRNHAVLQIFRSHSQFSLKQFWHNLKCFLTFKSG